MLFQYLSWRQKKIIHAAYLRYRLPNTVSVQHVSSDAAYQTHSLLSMHQYIHCYKTTAVACNEHVWTKHVSNGNNYTRVGTAIKHTVSYSLPWLVLYTHACSSACIRGAYINFLAQRQKGTQMRQASACVCTLHRQYAL